MCVNIPASSLSLSLSAVALSMLRSSEEQAPVQQNKFMGDIEELAASYERKLIEVSAVFLSVCFLLCISSDIHSIHYIKKRIRSSISLSCL